MALIINNQTGTINSVAVASPPLSIWGGQVTYSSVTALNISAGVFRSSDDTADIRCAAGSVSTSSSGIGGFQGTLSSSIPVFLFAALNPTTGATGYFMSNSQSPTPPTGYTKTRRIGSWYRNGTNLTWMLQNGSGSQRTYSVHGQFVLISFQNLTSGVWYNGSAAGICPTAHTLDVLATCHGFGQSSSPFGYSSFDYRPYNQAALAFPAFQVNYLSSESGAVYSVRIPVGGTVGADIRRTRQGGTVTNTAGRLSLNGWTEDV